MPRKRVVNDEADEVQNSPGTIESTQVEDHDYEEKPLKLRSRKKARKSEEDKITAALTKEFEDESEDPAEPNEYLKNKTTSIEAGQIRTIYVENFMCHRKFSINLGPGLNFIFGKNGSGSKPYSLF
jgi:hypothetical protein